MSNPYAPRKSPGVNGATGRLDNGRETLKKRLMNGYEANTRSRYAAQKGWEGARVPFAEIRVHAPA